MVPVFCWDGQGYLMTGEALQAADLGAGHIRGT